MRWVPDRTRRPLSSTHLLARTWLSRLPDPEQAGVRLNGFVDDRHQVRRESLQIGLVLGRTAEPLDHLLGLVLASEQPPVDDRSGSSDGRGANRAVVRRVEAATVNDDAPSPRKRLCSNTTDPR